MRGQVLELLIVGVIIFAGFVTLLVGSEVYERILETDAWPTNEVGNATNTAAAETLNVLDAGILFLMIGMGAALVIGAALIKTHPAFFLVSIIILGVLVVVSPAMTNAFMGFATSDALTDDATEYSLSTYAISNFPIYVVVVGVLIIIALYAFGGGREA